ncbi:chemotaxis response regulator protein-glutamate methylesterase [Clostridium sp. 19966]|uniref:protein-glutamate methylesterase/protein-glutamine glutaminase n=1 Tax=Clostridium sp. 19966 TaxID=2768166 RepID=UPI0028E09B2C|nr:chemotaxis response regulator protein-glutamate methylesterase [Clostridium sp. 19966]MDT8716683.1 chemotaxis response regulator protein-glutamate methylesterase [Clostridium sp. 19966]
MKEIKVMVVDDSALMRRIISEMLSNEADIEVIGTAKNGAELLEKLESEKPHVITLDVQMPIMNGIDALKELKKKGINIPVIVLSSVSERDTKLTMECLAGGAFDFIPKPSGEISLDINKVRDLLIEKIRLAYNQKKLKIEADKIPVSVIKENINTNISQKIRKNFEAIVIAASTGGPKALFTVITALPKHIGVPVFVVQHMPAGFTKAFAERVNDNSDINVVEAKDGENVVADTVYIAPGGFHMEVWDDKKIHLNQEPSMHGVRPAADKLFFSAAKVYQGSLISAVLTGMGKDGAMGTAEIKKSGGVTLAEHSSTCTIYGMPKAAFETGMVDEMLPLQDIPIQVVKLLKR